MERPLERRTSVRTAVVWESVRALPLPEGASVVDIGGGTGGLAVRLAELGHRVTVVDPSPDALAALGRRAREVAGASDASVVDRVVGLQGDLDDLPGEVGAASADLVLCHGVLGLVDEPAPALSALREVLRPGGVLSLVVGQRHAVVLARAMAGHFRQARAALEAGDVHDPGEERRFTAAEVEELLADAGFIPRSVQGIRVFADLVPGSLLDLEPGAGAALLDLERAVADRPEYLALAATLHLVATR